MKYNTGLLIFIILIIVQILLDKTFNKCENIYGKLLMFIHHIIGIYLWVGSLLLGNYLFHLIFVIIVQVLYIILNGCFLTDWQNKLCKFDKNELFRSWLNIIFGDENIKMTHIIGINIVILYDLYYINKEYKFIKL